MNFPIGKWGSGGGIKQLDFTICGCSEELLTVGGPDNRKVPVVRYWILDGDELITIVSVEDADGREADSGETSAIRRKLDPPDTTTVFEWAKQFLSSCDAPDGHLPPASPGGKLGAVGRNVD